MSVTNRFIRDGHVAVIYSRGYGAGWSSWNREYSEEDLIFDPGLVNLVLDNKTDEEMDCECYFDVQADSLAEAWMLVRRDYSHLAVDNVYEA
jgi:hypothetical protein